MLMAATVKVYACPDFRLVTARAVTDAPVSPTSLHVSLTATGVSLLSASTRTGSVNSQAETVYPVIAEPLFFSGAVHETSTPP